MKRKNLIVVGILCLMAVFTFSACSSTGTEATPTPAATEAAETTAPTAEVTGASITETEGTPASVDVNGSWTDPLTGNTLEMADGTFTITDEAGDSLATGTYQAAQAENTYDVTYEDGTTGSFVVKDTAVEFTDSATNAVVVYESATVE